MGLFPDQSPDAEQVVASVTLQLIVVEPLIITITGLADIEITGGLGLFAGIVACSSLLEVRFSCDSRPSLALWPQPAMSKLNPRESILSLDLELTICVSS